MGSLVWHPVWTAVPCFACPHSPYRPSEIGFAFLQHPISMPPVGGVLKEKRDGDVDDDGDGGAVTLPFQTGCGSAWGSISEENCPPGSLSPAGDRSHVSRASASSSAERRSWSTSPGFPRNQSNPSLENQCMLYDFQVRPENFQVDLKTPRCPARMK